MSPKHQNGGGKRHGPGGKQTGSPKATPPKTPAAAPKPLQAAPSSPNTAAPSTTVAPTEDFSKLSAATPPLRPASTSPQPSLLSQAELQIRQELESLDAHLHKLNKVRLDVAKDGACLFRSAAQGLFGVQGLHLKVRDACVDHLVAHEQDFVYFIDIRCDMSDTEGVHNEYVTYTERMREETAWAGQLEIQALSQCFKCNLVIYQAIPVSTPPELLKPGEPTHDIITTNIANGFDTVVALAYSHGNHYDVVMDVPELEKITYLQKITHHAIDTFFEPKAERESYWKRDLSFEVAPSEPLCPSDVLKLYDNQQWKQWKNRQHVESRSDESLARQIMAQETGLDQSGGWQTGRKGKNKNVPKATDEIAQAQLKRLAELATQRQEEANDAQFAATLHASGNSPRVPSSTVDDESSRLAALQLQEDERMARELEDEQLALQLSQELNNHTPSSPAQTTTKSQTQSQDKSQSIPALSNKAISEPDATSKGSTTPASKPSSSSPAPANVWTAKQTASASSSASSTPAKPDTSNAPAKPTSTPATPTESSKTSSNSAPSLSDSSDGWITSTGKKAQAAKKQAESEAKKHAAEVAEQEKLMRAIEVENAKKKEEQARLEREAKAKDTKKQSDLAEQERLLKQFKSECEQKKKQEQAAKQESVAKPEPAKSESTKAAISAPPPNSRQETLQPAATSSQATPAAKKPDAKPAQATPASVTRNSLPSFSAAVPSISSTPTTPSNPQSSTTQHVNSQQAKPQPNSQQNQPGKAQESKGQQQNKSPPTSQQAPKPNTPSAPAQSVSSAQSDPPTSSAPTKPVSSAPPSTQTPSASTQAAATSVRPDAAVPAAQAPASASTPMISAPQSSSSLPNVKENPDQPSQSTAKDASTNQGHAGSAPNAFAQDGRRKQQNDRRDENSNSRGGQNPRGGEKNRKQQDNRDGADRNAPRATQGGRGGGGSFAQPSSARQQTQYQRKDSREDTRQGQQAIPAAATATPVAPSVTDVQPPATSSNDAQRPITPDLPPNLPQEPLLESSVREIVRPASPSTQIPQQQPSSAQYQHPWTQPMPPQYGQPQYPTQNPHSHVTSPTRPAANGPVSVDHLFATNPAGERHADVPISGLDFVGFNPSNPLVDTRPMQSQYAVAARQESQMAGPYNFHPNLMAEWQQLRLEWRELMSRGASLDDWGRRWCVVQRHRAFSDWHYFRSVSPDIQLGELGEYFFAQYPDIEAYMRSRTR